MGTLLSIVAKFTADVEQYKKGVAEAAGGTDKLKESLLQTAQTASRMAAVGIAAVTAAAGYAVNKTLDWGNTLDSLADHLGTTTQESAGLALMVERVGGTTEQLTGAMDILTRGLIDANGELAPAGKAIENLGIAVFDADGKIRPATELFQDIADKIGPLPDGLDKTSKMMDIFGRSGGEMGDALGAAADGGLARFQDEAEKLGLAFSQDQVDNIIDAQIKFQEIKQTFDGLVISLGTNLLPVLSDVLTTITDWAKSDEGRQKIQDTADAIKNLVDWFIKIPEPVKIAGGSFLGLLLIIGPLISIVTGLTNAYTVLKPIVIAIGGVISGLSVPVIALIAAIAALIAAIIIFGDEAWNTFRMIGDIILFTIGKVVAEIMNTFIRGIEQTRNEISNLINWVNYLRNAFLSLIIPDWLMPGSPTPFEMGLRGINAAMRESVNQILPQFSAQLSMGGVAPAGSSEADPVTSGEWPSADDIGQATARHLRDMMLATGMVG
jgi:hypothetical protein